MATVQDAHRAAATRDADRVELILSQIEQLPTLPAVATRVLEAASSPDSSAADVVALIEMDQALTAKILSLVKRSDVGARDAATVSKAVVLLGFSAVCNAVLSIQIYETFQSVEPSVEASLDRREYWKHSLAVACAAQLIAQRVPRKVPPDEAFVGGLLHDLGKIALDACLPKSYARIIRETEARRLCISDVERAMLGLDHSVAGKRLATHWKLPPELVECIWLHHHPPESLPASIHSPRLVEAVHLADHIVRRQRIGYSGYNRIGDIPLLAKQLGLKEGAVDEIVAELGPKIEENCRLVGLGDLTASDLYAQALAGANDELSRLNLALNSANQRLQTRSRCFDALVCFHSSLSTGDRVPDVCRAAAVCAGQVIQAAGATVCFAANETGTVYHAGTTLEHGEATAVVMAPGSAEPDPSPEAGTLAPCSAWAEPIRERFADALGDQPVLMLPIRHAGELVGGVLAGIEPARAAKLGAFPDELDAFAGAFGLAIASARARIKTETLVEELADVNRRLHDAQAHVSRSKALGVIAETAAGAAHELNNPLAVVSGRAQMLADSEQDEQRRQTLTTIHEQAQRASRIVSELISFAKPEPPKPEVISLKPWLQQLAERWQADAPLGPDQFAVRLADPDLAVRVDPNQLANVFDALIANSIEATTPESVRLVINSASRASDNTVVVSVEDNGMGMSSKVLDHALDPFFSHREAGRGRGLGLSRAYSLTLANGGDLWLESTPGAGTRVYVELPACQAE